jgi:hypothetical protein
MPLTAQNQERFSPSPKVFKDSSIINILLGYYYAPNSAFNQPSILMRRLYYEYYARAQFDSIQINPAPLIESGADYLILTIKTIRREK